MTISLNLRVQPVLDLVAQGLCQNYEIQTFGVQTVGLCGLPRFYTLLPLQALEIIGSKDKTAKLTWSSLKDMRFLFNFFVIEDWKML